MHHKASHWIVLQPLWSMTHTFSHSIREKRAANGEGQWIWLSLKNKLTRIHVSKRVGTRAPRLSDMNCFSGPKFNPCSLLTFGGLRLDLVLLSRSASNRSAQTQIRLFRVSKPRQVAFPRNVKIWNSNRVRFFISAKCPIWIDLEDSRRWFFYDIKSVEPIPRQIPLSREHEEVPTCV